MDVILLKDVDRLGTTGQTLSVKNGFARNFLFPQGLAAAATTNRRRQAATAQAAQLRHFEAVKQKARELAQRLESVTLTIPVKVGDQDKLHGAVTAADIISRLKEQHILLEKHQIHLEAPLHQLGTHSVAVKLHPEVETSLRVTLAKD